MISPPPLGPWKVFAQQNDRSPSLLAITLCGNGLNVLIKRQTLAEWIKTHDPIIFCLQENHFKSKDSEELKLKGQKKTLLQTGTRREQGWLIYKHRAKQALSQK